MIGVRLRDPDPAAWQQNKDPADRTRGALTALHGPVRNVDAWLAGIADDLLKPWKPGPAKASVLAVLHHAVRYATWESLSASGLTDAELAEMVVQWLQALQPVRRRP